MTFTQPVSMQCSEEQYKRDLKSQLLAMGYTICMITNFDGDPILVTNQGGSNGRLTNIINSGKHDYNRYFISEYNPDLFLALAGMTDSEKGNVGEYWRYTGTSYDSFIEGKLYKQLTTDISSRASFIDDEGDLNGWDINNHKYFTKATKEKIINYFTKLPNQSEKNMNKVTVKKSEFKPLYDAACADWKSRFDNVLKTFVFGDEIEFTSEFVNDMRLACTKEQLVIFKTIFKEVDKNAFTKEINGDYITAVSRELFGNAAVLDAAYGSAVKIGRPDLRKRAFYVYSDFEVKLHPSGNGTIIEILKK